MVVIEGPGPLWAPPPAGDLGLYHKADSTNRGEQGSRQLSVVFVSAPAARFLPEFLL